MRLEGEWEDQSWTICLGWVWEWTHAYGWGAIGEFSPNLASGWSLFDTIFWGWVFAGPGAKDGKGVMDGLNIHNKKNLLYNLALKVHLGA